MIQIYRAVDGKEFLTEAECVQYEQANELDIKAFSFEDNIVLDDGGRRIIPDGTSRCDIAYGFSRAFYLKFKSKTARDHFAEISGKVCSFDATNLKLFSKDYLRFVWDCHAKEFISIDAMQALIDKTEAILNNYSTHNKNTRQEVRR